MRRFVCLNRTLEHFPLRALCLSRQDRNAARGWTKAAGPRASACSALIWTLVLFDRESEPTRLQEANQTSCTVNWATSCWSQPWGKNESRVVELQKFNVCVLKIPFETSYLMHRNAVSIITESFTECWLTFLHAWVIRMNSTHTPSNERKSFTSRFWFL